MRWKFALAAMTLAMLACAALGAPLSQPAAAPPSETVSAPPINTATPTEVTATLAPYADDTPSPPTLSAPVVSSPGITSLHMFNELDGWAISDNAVLRTTDGSLTWYNVSPQGVTSFGYSTAHAFLNTSQAWVLIADANDPMGTGLLYRTGDGGLSWTTYPVPFGGGALAFTDESNGWMMASLGVGAGSMGVSIYRTSDSGATWTQAYTNDPNLANAGDSTGCEHGLDRWCHLCSRNLLFLQNQRRWPDLGSANPARRA
jgi:photosystem II stability/assembly factor-like uncharacterized protein